MTSDSAREKSKEVHDLLIQVVDAMNATHSAGVKIEFNITAAPDGTYQLIRFEAFEKIRMGH